MTIATAKFGYTNFFVNNTIGNVGGITNAATSMFCGTTPSALPGNFVTGGGGVPFKLVLDVGTASEEIVTVTAGAGTSGSPFTITRASDGSTSHAHAQGASVQHLVTAGDETDFRTHEAATTTNTTNTIPATAPGTYVHGLPASAWATAAISALYENTLGSGIPSVTIGSIPGTYSHLLLIVQGKFTETTLQADDLLCTVNGSTSAVYSYVEQFVTNVAGSSTGTLFAGTNTGSAMTGWPILRLAASQSWAAANAGGGSAWIPNYTSATFDKMFQSQSGAGDGSTAFVDMRTRMGFFHPASAAAITSLTLTAPGGLNFTTGTFIGLYGLS